MVEVLIVAFDGLDYELIKEYNCKNIMQKEFGMIDVRDTHTVATSELFTNFLTGKTYKEHGITGLNKNKDSGFGFLNLNKNKNKQKELYDKSDLKHPTLFDKIQPSKALFVPVYNWDSFFKYKLKGTLLKRGGSLEEAEELCWWNHKRRFNRFQETVHSSSPNLLMCHFHIPDYIHHLYGTDALFDEDKIKGLYTEMDELAGIIKQETEEFDTVLFMSDHGLPLTKEQIKTTGKHEHNINAFYSLNKELGLDYPKMRDWHDIILEMSDSDSVVEI